MELNYENGRKFIRQVAGMVGIIIFVLFLSSVISWFSILLPAFLPFKIDSLTLIDLSANSLFVAVTTIYVFFTYEILTKTQDSIKQNEKNIELTLKSQKIILIQKKLEDFYYPLYDFLNAYVSTKEEKQKNSEKMEKSIRIDLNLKDSEQRNLASFNEIINHQYLADNRTKNLFSQFIHKIYDSCNSTDSEFIKIHENLIFSLEGAITELNKQFDLLINSDQNNYESPKH